MRNIKPPPPKPKKSPTVGIEEYGKDWFDRVICDNFPTVLILVLIICIALVLLGVR